MDGSGSADSLVLIAGPGPELFAALFVLIVAAAGTAVSVLMLRGGRREAWPLLGLFGILLALSLLVLTHVPTRLVFNAAGAEVAFWSLHDRRSWNDLPVVTVRNGPLGLWIGFVDRRGAGWFSPWSSRPGLFVPNMQIEPQALAQRVDTWRAHAQP